ncbi:MAG: helix-turn-helix domain-containing protein [Paludibacteraceae bacterium]|nr:helix-turn-helix domain-containing protein [Paludibacteraceae bacterium]
MCTKTRKEIARELGCTVRTLNKWIKPISKSLGIKAYQHYFTPRQVQAIYEFLIISKD